MWPDVGRGEFEDFAKKGYKRCCDFFELLFCVRTDSVVKDADEPVDIAVLIRLGEIRIRIRIF